MSWVLPGRAAETHSGMPEGPVRAWTRPAWWCAFPEYHLSISVPFLLVFLSEQRSEAMRVPSRIRYGSPCSATFSRVSCRVGASALRTSTPSSLYRWAVACEIPKPWPRREARPVAEPGEDEDGLLVAGQGAGSVPGAEFLPAFPQEVRNLDHELERDVKSDTIGDHAEPSQGRERCLRLMHLARRGAARPGPWRWLRRWRAFRVRSRLTASMTPRRGGIAAS